MRRRSVLLSAVSGTVAGALTFGRSQRVAAHQETSLLAEHPLSGDWMAMDARTDIGPTGMGLCTSTLFDLDGAVGASTQSLLVAPR